MPKNNKLSTRYRRNSAIGATNNSAYNYGSSGNKNTTVSRSSNRGILDIGPGFVKERVRNLEPDASNTAVSSSLFKKREEMLGPVKGSYKGNRRNSMTGQDIKATDPDAGKIDNLLLKAPVGNQQNKNALFSQQTQSNTSVGDKNAPSSQSKNTVGDKNALFSLQPTQYNTSVKNQQNKNAPLFSQKKQVNTPVDQSKNQQGKNALSLHQTQSNTPVDQSKNQQGKPLLISRIPIQIPTKGYSKQQKQSNTIGSSKQQKQVKTNKVYSSDDDESLKYAGSSNQFPLYGSSKKSPQNISSLSQYGSSSSIYPQKKLHIQDLYLSSDDENNSFAPQHVGYQDSSGKYLDNKISQYFRQNQPRKNQNYQGSGQRDFLSFDTLKPRLHTFQQKSGDDRLTQAQRKMLTNLKSSSVSNRQNLPNQIPLSNLDVDYQRDNEFHTWIIENKQLGPFTHGGKDEKNKIKSQSIGDKNKQYTPEGIDTTKLQQGVNISDKTGNKLLTVPELLYMNFFFSFYFKHSKNSPKITNNTKFSIHDKNHLLQNLPQMSPLPKSFRVYQLDKKNCKRFFNNIVHFYENGNSDITLRQMYDIVTKHEIGKIDMINDNEFYIKIYEDN